MYEWLGIDMPMLDREEYEGIGYKCSRVSVMSL